LVHCGDAHAGDKGKTKRTGLCCGRSRGADFAALLRKQFDYYGRIIREANIKAE
jgi:hypothetical protein